MTNLCKQIQAVDLKRGRLVVAELGNNSVDVVDLPAKHVLHRLAGLSEPQGIGYSEKSDLVSVANAGDGTVRLLRGADFIPDRTIQLGDDKVRVDPHTGLVVVGIGGGGLALIDPATRARVSASTQRTAAPASTSRTRGKSRLSI